MSNRLGVFVMVLAMVPVAAMAQTVPESYERVTRILGKPGDFEDGVLKVGVPRNDLNVTIAGRPAPTPFGFGGWVAFAQAEDGSVLMGDLVLTEDEVNPVMSAILDNDLQVSALHNHFFWEQPRMFYMHVQGHGPAVDLARRLKPALDLIDEAAAASSSTAPTPASPGRLDTGLLAETIGHEGEHNGPVYKITIARPDFDVRHHGASINARMGLNTWAAFAGTDADAMVAGDVAMLEHEVTPVLEALRSSDIAVVAVHHHMVGARPVVIFLHYFGEGSAERLAKGVRAAVDLLGKVPASR